MENKKLRFAPIIRVSTISQTTERAESLRTQETQIRRFVETLGGVIPDRCWKYVGQESATPDKERKLLNALLQDASRNVYDAVIVCDMSRWSRDNEKSKSDLRILKQNGIRFFVGTSEQDLHNSTDAMMMGMFTEINEWFAKEQARKSMDNRIHRASRGIPTSGRLPFARTWNGVEWGIDTEKQQIIESVARRYLAGESSRSISGSVGMNWPYLWKVLTQRSGETWVNTFLGTRVVHQVPRLLPEETIEAIRQRASLNKTYYPGKPKHHYLLSGLLRCGKCGLLLAGQTNHSKKRYYRHRKDLEMSCKLRKFVPANEIENSVLLNIVAMMGDPARVERAIRDSVPDLKRAEELKREAETLERELKTTAMQRERLIDAIAEGTITKSESATKMDKIRDREAFVRERLDTVQEEIRSMPDPARMKRITNWSGKVISNAMKSSPALALKRPYEWQRDLLTRAFTPVISSTQKLGVYVWEKKGGWKIEIRGVFETMAMGVPMSDEQLMDLFGLDPEHTDLTSELQSIKSRLQSSLPLQGLYHC